MFLLSLTFLASTIHSRIPVINPTLNSDTIFLRILSILPVQKISSSCPFQRSSLRYHLEFQEQNQKRKKAKRFGEALAARNFPGKPHFPHSLATARTMVSTRLCFVLKENFQHSWECRLGKDISVHTAKLIEGFPSLQLFLACCQQPGVCECSLISSLCSSISSCSSCVSWPGRCACGGSRSARPIAAARGAADRQLGKSMSSRSITSSGRG